MMKLQIPKPSRTQKRFLTDQHKFLAFGGARGGGKSWAVRVLAITLCLKYPGIKVMIIRKTYPELTANHIQPMVEMLRCYSKDRVARYNDQKKQMTFPNGSIILFRYCDTDKDADRFQGTEVDVLFVDEATQQPEETMKKLTACVRGVNNFPKLIRYTCNPGGIGHAWVKRIFIDRKFEDGEDPDDYAFIQSYVYDNKPLLRSDPDYIRSLQALPARLRDMWLHGNWDIFEGQFFEDLRLVPDIQAAHDHGCDDTAETLTRARCWTHVIEPFNPPAGWTVFRSYDFGYGKPFSCAWWAVDYGGVFYRILELYGCTDEPNTGVKWSPERQFEEISRIEREHPWLAGREIDGVADPAIWDASRGISIAETAMKYGLYFQPGDNQRIPGWMQCHYRLQFDDNGYPMMYVFQNCRAFIRTVPLMMYSTTIPEDLDTTLEDHVSDEWRYACMSRPIQPTRPAEEKQIFIDPLNQHTTKGRFYGNLSK